MAYLKIWQKKQFTVAGNHKYKNTHSINSLQPSKHNWIIQLVVLNSTTKLHLNSTLTPLVNSSHQLGAKTQLKLDFLNPSFYQVRVKTWISKLHLNSTLTPLLNSSHQPGKSGLSKLQIHCFIIFLFSKTHIHNFVFLFTVCLTKHENETSMFKHM